MDDRELLEAAAKAAGIPVEWATWVANPKAMNGCSFKLLGTYTYWNPLTDDGDALRLAVRLRMTVLESSVRKPDGDVVNVFPGEAPDRYAATRRAIVRAAAAMATGS